jgi:hypothetical protein
VIGLLRRLLPIGGSSASPSAEESHDEHSAGSEFERRIEAARRRLKATIPRRDD